MIVRQEEILRVLVETSTKAMNYLEGAAGQVVPSATVGRLRSHANQCRQWLVECVGDQGLDSWLSTLRPDQRRDFEWSVLPYCLLVSGKNIAEVYDMVGSSLDDQNLSDRFPDCPLGDLLDLLKVSRFELKDFKASNKIVELAKMVVPPIIADGQLLCPRVYGAAVVDYKAFPNFKVLVHAVYGEVINEEAGLQAMDAIAWEKEGPSSYNLMRGEIRRYSPKAFPALRQRVTGSSLPSMAECSQRLAAVMETIHEGSLGETGDYLVEAISLSPTYRKEVMPLDLAESIASMVKVGQGKHDDLTYKNILDNLANLIDRINLSEGELNYVLAKSAADNGRNGYIQEMMGWEPHRMLQVFLRYAKSQDFDLNQSAASKIYTTLLKQFDPLVLKSAVGTESGIAAMVYKMTGDRNLLPLITDETDRDDCFGSDLGL